MEIVFNLPHVFENGSNPVENAKTLRLLLESLIAVNRVYLEHHSVPTLYRSGVVYRRTITWDSIPALYAKRYGDCKSLAAALIAEYRQKGIKAEPEFRFLPRGNGGNLFHILVRLSRTRVEDPSAKLGMTIHSSGYA